MDRSHDDGRSSLRLRRRRVLRVLVMTLALGLLTSACALTQVNDVSSAWTNGQRSGVGVAALAADPTLQGCAQRWADVLASQGSLSHDADFGACLPAGATAAAENLAAGPSLGAALDAILGSPPHVAIMNDPRWTRFGIASARRGNGDVVLVWRFSN